MKTLIAFLMLASMSLADSLVLVTQDPCPPCVAAKKLLAATDLQGLELKEVQLKDNPYHATRTPTLVLLDNDGKFKSSVTTIDKTHVVYLLSLAEVEALQSLVLPDFIEEPQPVQDAGPFGAPPRRIPYTISTEYRNGTFQGTFTWGQVDHALSLLERYWNVDFVRVNSGPRLRIIQANTNPNSTWAAWTRGTDIRISPVFNFGGNRTTCEMVVCHEFGHAAGGSSHTNVPGTLMHPNGGALIAQTDYRFFAAYQWKSALRPHQEPNFAIEYWRGNVARGDGEVEQLLPLIICGH